MRYSRLCTRLGESAVAPGVSLSLYPRLLPRLSFGELKVFTPCFHELRTRLESGGWALPPYIGSLLPMCAIPKCQCTTSLRHVEVYRHTNGCHRLFSLIFLVGDNKIRPFNSKSKEAMLPIERFVNRELRHSC